ncbi:hypothetical protein BDR22DRAFT_860065 [Usnea florida]
MTQFTDLPNEIVAQIAQNVHPRDIVNFSSTSKFIHSVCEPSLKVHQEMERKYKKCKCTGNGNLMAYLLSDIILHPTAALYVECLDTSLRWDGWFEPLGHKGRSYHPRYPQKMMSRLTQAVADTIPSAQVSTWTAALERGDEDPVLALLLLRLPGISTLKVSFGRTSQCLFQTLRRRMEGPGLSSLSALTTLYIDLDHHHLDPECEAISYFATLPSLRSMEIQGLDVEQGVGDCAYRLQPQSSNITSIIIRHCSIRKEALYHFFQGFKALRRFSCDQNFILVHPGSFHAPLLAHCKDSLEYLSLSTDWDQYMGSLRDFENLKEVETHTSYLLDLWHSEKRDLAQKLPASIEKVHLSEDIYADPENIQNTILNAAKDKQKLLPNLQELRISIHANERKKMGVVDVEHMEALAKFMVGRESLLGAKCEEAGFKLIIDLGRYRRMLA